MRKFLFVALIAGALAGCQTTPTTDGAARTGGSAWARRRGAGLPGLAGGCAAASAAPAQPCACRTRGRAAVCAGAPFAGGARSTGSCATGACQVSAVDRGVAVRDAGADDGEGREAGHAGS